MSTVADITIPLEGDETVSGLLEQPDQPRAVYVLGHGAGAGMRHAFMEQISAALAERSVAVLRYQFPYMERGSRRPDRPPVAHATIRAAVAEASRHLPETPIFAGGKSFGGRMTSQAQAAEAMTGVRGLVFLGYPLHPPGKPGTERGDHLADIAIPMLFLQGTRDEFGGPDLLTPVVDALSAEATIEWLESGNHSFRVPKRTGLSPEDVMNRLADQAAAWMLARV